VLIDLVLAGNEALVVGDGEEPALKTLKLVDAKANVTVMGGSFTERLRAIASRYPLRVSLVSAVPTPTEVKKAVARISPNLVFISTGNSELDERLSAAVRAAQPRGPLICVVDDPRLNDFNMPAIAKRGDIRIGVSTGGRSPAMAGILRRKIEKAITPEEVLQVRLQGYIRKASRKHLMGVSSRRAFAYRVIEDEEIGALLRKKDYGGARRLAVKMLLEEASAPSDSRGARGGAKRHA
jgi:precorrin-2 dehydrogenase / sirohydrochlorin ferrochelatase